MTLEHTGSSASKGFTSVVSSGGSQLLPTTVASSKPLDPAQHPCVWWWTKQSWLKRTNHGDDITILDEDDHSETSSGIKSTDYLEHASGRPLNRAECQPLYAHAQVIWTTFANNSSTGPPPGYKMATLEYLAQYRAEMEREFPILQLCERHWKADHVWILNYPSWLRNWEKKVQRTQEKNVKIEGGEKRKHEDGDERNDRKKQKLNDKVAKRSKKADKAPEQNKDTPAKQPEILVVSIQRSIIIEHTTQS